MGIKSRNAATRPRLDGQAQASTDEAGGHTVKGEIDVGIRVQVPVGRLGFSDPYIRGRNGDWEITALRIHQWGTDDPQGDGAVDVHGIGKRGEPIVGGFRCLRADDIDALCKAWIEARGGLAILPGDKEVTALIPRCSGIICGAIIGRDVDALDRVGTEHVGDGAPPKWEYDLESVELLPAPQQGSEGQSA